MLSCKFRLAFLTLGALLAADVAASGQPSSLKWFPCQQNGSTPFTCGSLGLSLDYTDSSSNQSLQLSLIKINATKTPKRGSILFNDGGPGIDTRSLLTSEYGRALLAITGGSFDLIGFAPR